MVGASVGLALEGDERAAEGQCKDGGQAVKGRRVAVKSHVKGSGRSRKGSGRSRKGSGGPRKGSDMGVEGSHLGAVGDCVHSDVADPLRVAPPHLLCTSGRSFSCSFIA